MKRDATTTIALLLYVGLLAGTAPGADWNLDGNGNWNVNGNWVNPATYPNAVDAVADMSLLDITANRNINVEAAITIGSLALGDSSGTQRYELDPGTAGVLTFDVSSGTATLTDSSAARDYIDAPVTLNDTLVITTSGSGQLEFRSTIGGSGGLTKTGPGYLSLRTAVNNYTGTSTYSGGAVLHFNNNIGSGNLILNGGVFEDYWSGTFNRALGTGVGQVQITGGASGFSGQGSNGLTVRLYNNASTEVVWGTATFNPSTLVLQAPTANFNGKVTFQNLLDLNGATRTIAVNKDNEAPGGFALMTGVIRDATGGSAGLIKTGVGLLRLSAANTFTGGVQITQGAVRVENASALGNSGPLTFAGVGTRLDLRADPTISELSSTGAGYGQIFSGSGARTLTVDQSTDTTYSGIIEDGSGTMALVKTGSGSMKLNGVNTYTGTTTVNGGTLGGTGSVAGAVSVASGATLAPGASPGTFSVSSNVTIASGGTLAIEIDDAQSPKNSQLAVTNTLDITDATLSFTVTGAPSEFAYPIATYGTLVGTFTTFSGMPAGYAIDYAYGGNVIAIKEAGGETQPVVTNWVTDIDVGTAILRGELDDGTTADAYVCWGTSDAGTNSGTAAWEHVESLGSINENAPFSTNLTGLLYGLEYNYRLYATNTVGDAWSGVKTFTTVVPESSSTELTADGQTFDAYFEDYDGESWLLIGRGRDGWEFDTDGQGNVDDVSQGLKTTAAFAPACYSDAIVNDLLSQASIAMNDLTVRVSRASTIDGTGEYQDSRWYNLSVGSYTWDYDDSGMTVTHSIENNPLNENGSYPVANTETRDNWNQGSGDDADRIFTWPHESVPGFRYGSNINGDLTATTFLYRNNWAVPYTEVYIPYDAPPSVTIGINNTAAQNVGTTTAELVGTLDGTGSVFTVHAYYSTNDHADAAAWLADGTASKVAVGTYTNVTGQSVTGSVSALTGGTVYYYTMVASNAVTNIWATPNAVFGTDGPPTVINDGYTPQNQYATLSGNLLSTGGAPTTVRIYWGETDGTNNAAAWANTNTVSTGADVGAFSTSTSTDLTYGVTYYFRAYAINANGEAWASDTAEFLTGLPSANAPVMANMEAWYDAGRGLTLSGSDVTQWDDQSGNGRHTTSVSGTPEFTPDESNGQPAIKFRNEHFVINHAIVPREQYFVFRSGRYDSNPGDPHKWHSNWGGPWGQQNNNGWMLEHNQARTWNNRIPRAMVQNGTNCTYTLYAGNQYYFTRCGEYMVLKVNPLNYGSANSYIARPNSSWHGGHLDIAEIIIYSDTKSAADESIIGGYLAGKYGIDVAYPEWTSISNEPVSTNITSTSATFNATLRGLGSVFDVRVYWGTSDGGSDAGAWGNTNYVGSYTNVDATSVSFTNNALSAGTEYFYTFSAQNAATNLWATPSESFQTVGAPAVNTAGGATDIRPVAATLNGALSEGAIADIYFCWGYVNAGTNSGTGAWQNVEPAVSAYLQETVSVDISGALYGLTYYYACFASNDFGTAWSPVTTFTTLQPNPMDVTGGLEAWYDASYGVTTSGDNVTAWADKSGNGRHTTSVTGTPTYEEDGINGWPAVLFHGGNNRLNINHGIATREEYIVFRSGRYVFYPADPHKWGPDWGGPFGRQDNNHWMLENNQTRTWNSRVPLAMKQNGTDLTPVSSQYYMTDVGNYFILKANPATYSSGNCLLGRPNNSWGNGYIDVAEVLVYNTPLSEEEEDRVGAYLSEKYGITTTYPTPSYTGIENTGVTGIFLDQATLNGTLSGTQAVFDVWVYWSTNDGVQSKSAWLAGSGDSQYMGSFTNVASTNLSHGLSGLTGSTTYYYTYYASNVSAELWGDTVVFGSAGPPEVENRGVTNVTTTGATLKGILSAGGKADVYLCWGTADAGTNSGTGAWQHVIPLGTNNAGNEFSTTISNLYYGLTYRYRCYATNGLGEDWSHPATSFSTAMPEADTVPELPVTANLEAWYDACEGLGLNGNNVTSWDDRSGNDRHTTSVSGTPELSNDAINGRPGIKFRNEHFVINHAMVPREEYIVFRSGRYDSDPGNPHLWYGNWGGPFGQQNNNGWMLENNQARTWNSRIPIAMKQNGTNATYVSSQYYFDQVGNYFVLKVNPLNYASANAYIARPNNNWHGAHLDIAEIIIYSATNSVADEDAIGSYLEWKYGIETTYSGNFAPPNASSISNSAVSGVAPGQAQLNAYLSGSDAVHDVYAFWSTNDYGTNKVGWLADGSGAYVGAYTNALTDVSHFVSGGLLAETTYYYTFYGSNELSEIWGVPSTQFTSAGPPVVTNSGATGIDIGEATLNGELTDGGGADIYFVWGSSDAGTNSGTGAWQHVIPMGTRLQGVPFSTNISGLLYGIQYEYRVMASNDLGVAWSGVDAFLTLPPVGSTAPRNLDFETGDLTGWSNVGATIGADTLFRNGNNPVSHTRLSPKQGTYYVDGYRSNAGDSDGWTGIIESDTFILGANAHITFVSGGGSDGWSGTPDAPATIAGIGIEREVSHGTWENILWQSGGGNSLVARDLDASAYAGETVRIRIYDNDTGGWGWTAADNFEVSAIHIADAVSITNNGATNIRAYTADLVGTLEATQSVFSVSVYWSTNSANTNAATWLADTTKSNAFVGTYTNVAGVSLTNSLSGLPRGETYYYTFVASNEATNLWASPTASFTTDATPPSPDPMGFETPPSPANSTTISMVASNATDALNEPVEYLFNNLTNGHSSGWTTNAGWSDTGLSLGETYGYQVRARDAVSNMTAWSVELTASPLPDTTPPSPDPMVFETVPYPSGPSAITMVATNASDPNWPIEYLFENTTLGLQSGWITSRTWTDTNVTNSHTYGYRVMARDADTNMTAWSGVETVVAVDVYPPNSGPGGAPSPASGTINPETGVTWAVGDTYQLVFVSSALTNMNAREDVHFWNDYVNTLADGSSLPGMGNLTWKIIGSDLSTHAKDNAVVSAQVFLVDTTTKVVDNATDMWDGNIDAAINKDENGNAGAGTDRVWTGSYNDGTRAGSEVFDGTSGNASSAQRTQVSGSWLRVNGQNRANNYHVYALSQLMSISHGVTDTDPPVPATMTWAEPPLGATSNTIAMKATLAYDLVSAPVEYLFTNTVTHASRAWSTDRSWVDTVAVNSLNTYRVKARDAAGNETAWSDPYSMSPVLKGPGGVVAPGGMHPVNGTPWQVGDVYQLVFVSSTVSNLSARQDIHFWNEYINTVADGSGLPGVPDLTWKVIGADTDHHARDNALVSSPVYLLDGTTKIVDNFSDMWDESVDTPVNKDEDSNSVSGDTRVWSGANGNGTSGGGNSLNGSGTHARCGRWNEYANRNWVYRDDQDKSGNYNFYGLSQPIRIAGGGADSTPPVPATMTWADAPSGLTTNSIVMKSTLAYDLDSPPVEYCFTNTVTGETTGWQASRTWVNTVGVNSLNTYRVKARDAVGNETAWSAEASTTPLLKGPNGVVAPGGIHPTNGVPWQAGDIYHLVFVSSTVSNLSALQDIHHWNEYINTVADGSSLPGVPELTWKLIGADTSRHARDNAVVSAPVYLLDGSTKIVDGYADMWDDSVDAPINRNENDSAVSGDTRVWSGANGNGTSGGGNSLNGSGSQARCGRWNEYVSRNWIYRDDQNKPGNYRFYGLSQPIRVSDGSADNTSPVPATMTWDEAPHGVTLTTIEMKATLAYDLDSPSVAYCFTNTVTGDTSGWQASRTWVNTVGVNSLNTYQVKARDAVGNETAWSAPYDATPVLKGPGGVVAPGGPHPTNGSTWQSGDIYHLAWVSSTTVDMLGLNDIHWWNDYVKTLAGGSSLPGVPNLTWKIIASDEDTHARDNALVTAPVYLLNGSTKIADSYAYMWNGSIDNPLNIDENGNAGSGSSDVWTGTQTSGARHSPYTLNGSHGNASRAHRTVSHSQWIYRDTQNRSGLRHVYALSQPIRISSGAADTNAPSPNPMTFDVGPAGITVTSIAMRATLAYDLDSPDVEYLFTNSVQGTDSGWQASPDWTNIVTIGWANTYRVKARDAVGNETDWSAPVTVKPLLKGPNGIITPTGLNPDTGELWSGGETYHLAFVTRDTGPATPSQEIAAWNAFVQGKANLSTLTGVPDATWKIIGSTVAVHARDNAAVSAPVYLLDGATKIADSYADMWDSQIASPLNVDEYGDPGTGSSDAWTGSTSSGTRNGNYALNGSDSRCSRGHRTVSHSQWLYRDNQGETGNRHFYALSEPLTIDYMAVNVVNGGATNIGGTSADLVGTVYAPLGQDLDVSVYWSTNDNADGAAWLADGDALSIPVGSYNDVIAQAATGTVNTLTPDVRYYYRFRGTNAEVSVWASSNTAFAVDTEGPTPDPMSFESGPESAGADEIVMTAVTATDTLSPPVEYYFENVSNSTDSGWISSPTWSSTGLVADTAYGFRVQARDAAGNTNGWSDVVNETTSIPWNGLVAYWSFDDEDVSGTTILDVADDPNDGKGDHDATLRYGAWRPATDLPGDPNGGLAGNYFDANYNGYAVVDTFGGGAAHTDLDGGEQITVAGWFRELPDGGEDALVSKHGDVGWDIRRNGGGSSIRGDLRNTSGSDSTSGFTVENNANGGPWYFIVLSYTKDSDTQSTARFYAADSGAADKRLKQIGGDQVHSTDNDIDTTGSMVVFGARDTSDNDGNPVSINRQSGSKMDEIAIWNRGITLEEATALYGLGYFSGLKANNSAIQILLSGSVGTTVADVGPHSHSWERISNAGTAGDITGSIAGGDALIQVTSTEALQFAPSGVSDDVATTDENSAVSISVLLNDELAGALGHAGALEIIAVTQPDEGAVTIDGGSQSLTFDPTGSTVLQDLTAGESSVQTFTYTAKKTAAADTATGTVSVTVSGVAAFGDALAAHWTFDDADVLGSTVYDLVDDAGDGKGDHDATLYGGVRPATELPGDPDGGLTGNYYDANGNKYGVVDTFSGGASHHDLDAREQFTVAGWFKELPDGSEDALIAKYGDSYGWDIRRSGGGSSLRTDLQRTSGGAASGSYSVENSVSGGPWYFVALTYTKDSDERSTRRFYTADSAAANKGLRNRSTTPHAPDNDVDETGSMVVFAARDYSNADTTGVSINRHSNSKMDDIAIWNRGLSMAEVAAWYGLSYFSGLKATNAAIATLVEGPVGTAVTNVGPHGHNWTVISTNGTQGDISGSVSNVNALVQITTTEALELSLPDIVADDDVTTDEETEISISVLLNDQLDGGLGVNGALEVTSVTQPTEGAVTIDGGSQSVTFDPTGSTVLHDLLALETSVQTFTYTARNTNTLTTGTGTVTVTVNGLASFGDALVAHWTFDDDDVSDSTVYDIADDAGFGKGDHDARMIGGLRPATGLPGDPSAGLTGNYYDANLNTYAIVDQFGGAATHQDLDAGEEFTIAGWFQELADENEGVYVAKYGDGGVGWDIRRQGTSSRMRGHLRGSSGSDNTSDYTIENNQDGGPWYFVAMSYTKESDTYSVHRYYTADSAAANKGLYQRGGNNIHSPDNDVADTGSMVLLGGRDTSNNDTTGISLSRPGSIKMDDVAIWNRGLSHEELIAWYGLSYFSGLKATNAAIATLVEGGAGTAVTSVGPHGHNWTRISTNGTAGEISGGVSNVDAIVQLTDTEALQLSLPDVVSDDAASTDEETAISISVLLNDKIDGGRGSEGALEIIAITQPSEGVVAIEGGSQSLNYDPSGSTVLHNLLANETSVQTFDYTVRNTNTLTTGTGTVTVTVNGLASFSDALVAHWTFDDDDVSDTTILDVADDAGFGKGSHDAVQVGGLRPSTSMPGDPDGGLAGNHFDANGNAYAVVNSFSGGATHDDLDAGDEFTLAGWFRELADENEGVYVAKYGDSNLGWDLRRQGTSARMRCHLRGSSGNDNTSDYTIENNQSGTRWYFVVLSYTKNTEDNSTMRFFTADSAAADKGLKQRGSDLPHSPDNDVANTGSMVLLGGRDTSNNDATGISLSRPGSIRMDDVAIWNRGLSLEEAAAWYGLSYFSGLKATNTAMTTLLDGGTGTVVSAVGPHGHTWTKISNAGTQGAISGTVGGEDALIQVTATEALQLSIPDVVGPDSAETDAETPISIDVLDNDKIGTGALEIIATTQPAEGSVTIDGGNLSLTFDPTGSAALADLEFGETSVQVFTYTARNTITLVTGTGTVTVTVGGVPTFADGLVAHWTFDDADVSGIIIHDVADDTGAGKGGHDATMNGGSRLSTDLPGDPGGGPQGSYYNANGNGYTVVDRFDGGASHSDLEIGDQFTVAGWFRERPDGNDEPWISKDNGGGGWRLRRNGSGNNAFFNIYGTSGSDNSANFAITGDNNGGPWYFMAVSYRKDSDSQSTLRFFAADSEAVDNSMSEVGSAQVHTPDSDATASASMVVMGASDNPGIANHSSTKMDDIAIWNRGLTLEEVTAWYGLSYFSGLKATNTAMGVLLDGAVGTSVTGVGPHGHNWQKISHAGTAGDISGTVAAKDALIQITDTEALQLSVMGNDSAVTDEATPVSISVLVNDQVDGGLGSAGALEISAVTQPSEGVVTIDGGAQSLTFDPTGSAALEALAFDQTSVQTFTYTARNTNTLGTATGSVTVTVSGLATAFNDALVAHWTFDNAHVSGNTILDLADNGGYGKGGHDATLYNGSRPGTGLPGDPAGGLDGNYFDANGDGYALVDDFDGAASHADLAGGDQFTIAGWFRELPDDSGEPWISKGNGGDGWRLRRNGIDSTVFFNLYGTDGVDDSAAFTTGGDVNGGPWYFMAVSYRKYSESHSALRFYAADSGAMDKGMDLVGTTAVHSPDNDSSPSSSMVVFGAAHELGIVNHSSAKMDDIAFWNRGLTLEEITAWYGMSYFSGVKATDAAITTLLNGPVGTSVTTVGPRGHTWEKISHAGTPGDVSGSLAGDDALVQITATEALEVSVPRILPTLFIFR